MAPEAVFDSGLSGSLTQLTDGSSYLIAGANVTISTGTNGAVTITSTGGGAIAEYWISPENGIIKAEVTSSRVEVPMLSASNGIEASGSAVFAGNGGISVGPDVTLFVSGATGANSADKSVFGGTVHVSGNIQLENGISLQSRDTAGQLYVDIVGIANGTGAGLGTDVIVVGDYGNATGILFQDSAELIALITGSNQGYFSGSYQFPQGISGSLTKLTDGSSYLIAGTNVTISTGTNGAVTISSAGGGAEQYWFSTVNESVYTTGSTLFSGPGGVGVDSPALLGSDMFFFVSGAIGSKDTNVTGTAVFGGDVVASGTMNLEGGLRTPLKIVTSLPYTASITDYIIAVSASAGPGVALPSTALVGRNYIVKDVSGSAAANNIVISVNGGGLIDGASSYTLSINRGSATFVYFGTSIGWGVV